MPETVLIADDDRELCGLLAKYLGQEGFEVQSAHDGEAALAAARRPGVDALVLDIMMPGKSGLEVLKQLRADSMLPVIMLTARGEGLDRILGLELGADDYLPKPCNPRELVARLRAVLRRSAGAPLAVDLEIDDLELQPGGRRLLRGGRPLELTSTEFTLAMTLLQQAGQVVSKRDLYLAVLGREPMRHDRSIDMHVSNLRRKLGPAPGGGPRLETVRGIGYQYVVNSV